MLERSGWQGITECLKRGSGPVNYGDSGPQAVSLPPKEAGSRPLNKVRFCNFEKMLFHARLGMYTSYCSKTASIISQGRNEMIISRLLVAQSQPELELLKTSWPGILDSAPMVGLRGQVVPPEAMCMLDGSA